MVLLPIIFIRVDYSAKYGLGYLMSDGSFGVYYNDNTKMVLDPSNTYIEYLEKQHHDRVDVMTGY